MMEDDESVVAGEGKEEVRRVLVGWVPFRFLVPFPLHSLCCSS
mgnify:FL=1